MSQEIFQLKIDETYHDSMGAIEIADDKTVCGKDDDSQYLNLHETMEDTRLAVSKVSEVNDL